MDRNSIDWAGPMPAVTTPFHDDGRIDEAEFSANLVRLLKDGATGVVVGGCTTEGCVESTARDAMFCDYYVVIAEGCVGSDDREQHCASMLLMRHRFDVATSTAIQKTWTAA